MLSSIPIKPCLIIGLLCTCAPLHASFIEQTLGAAVVKDATAVFFNPAALTVVPKPQFIAQGTFARQQFQFSGTALQLSSGDSKSGTAISKTNFTLPSFYLSFPFNSKLTAGFAVVINDFTRDSDNHSVLRYVQARNHTDNVDLVPAIGLKINPFFSVGGNLNLTSARFLQQPVSGIPSLNIPEGHSLNRSKAESLGGDFGALVKLSKKTNLGFNYRSAVTYHLNGSSTLRGPMYLSSDNFHFKFWTPARSVLSLSQFVKKELGFIATLQYLQWDIFKKANVYNFATVVGSQALIVPKAEINYHFHNSWLMTVGTIYHASSKWIIRVAATYNQSPANGRYQISSGDSLIVGSSMGYQLSKNLTVDGSYGHAFFKKQGINILSAQNIIRGINRGEHDGISLKLTLTA